MKFAITPTTSNPEPLEMMSFDNELIFTEQSRATRKFTELLFSSDFDWTICIVDDVVHPISTHLSLCTIKSACNGSSILTEEPLKINMHFARRSYVCN